MSTFITLSNNVTKKLAAYSKTSYPYIYWILESYCYGEKDTCFPSQETLAKDCNVSVRTIQRAIRLFKELGLIKVFKRSKKSNLYKILNKIKTSTFRKIREKSEEIKEKATKEKSKSNSSYEKKNNENNKPLNIKNYNLNNKENKSAVEYKNKYNKKKDTFNNFKGRNYSKENIKELEEILLEHSYSELSFDENIDYSKYGFVNI